MELIPRRSGGTRRPTMRQVVVVMPSAFTLGNLFFGFWAIVSAFNGNFRWAGWFIVFSGILDMLDGRVARLSNTGSRFGAELDSLVDVMSFGVAPALLIYFLDFASAGRFAWILSFIYVTAVALRLARFNVTSAGVSTGWFTGCPPPGGHDAGRVLPVQPDRAVPCQRGLPDLQHQGLVVRMFSAAVLMVSNVSEVPADRTAAPRGSSGWRSISPSSLGAVLAPEYLFPWPLRRARHRARDGAGSWSGRQTLPVEEHRRAGEPPGGPGRPSHRTPRA
jgi:CDP-diacylglycerol--serine O-phosphatidyltransferase